MLLLWKVRYLDTRDREYKDRSLCLDTSSLDVETRAAVELCLETTEPGSRREMLRYRHLFHEHEYSGEELNELAKRAGSVSTFFLADYVEDENSNKLSLLDTVRIETGIPDALVIPSGARQHDIDYMLAEKGPVPIEDISVSASELSALGYFCRDLEELEQAAFMIDGPGHLKRIGQGPLSIETAVSDEEIRSFVTIFRRLYMTKYESGNFLGAAEVFARALGDHPLSKWVQRASEAYKADLAEKPWPGPGLGGEQISFTRKRLIDVFLYTRYAHQPDDKKTRQFKECLRQVGGQEARLTWLFLTEIWKCAHQIQTAGVQIRWFFQKYCEIHNAAPNIIPSTADGHAGIGAGEKQQAKRARLLREKSEQLAMELWKRDGRPEGGPVQFVRKARSILEKASDQSADSTS